ncbi:hypothetical protein BC829DRAFT_391402 [Chytridium lagenaria]|nr:hypothetical protein BC829DRAFT_391402 [Chytridium lagenaria]
MSSSASPPSTDTLPSPASTADKPSSFWTRKRKIYVGVCLGVGLLITAIMIPVLLLVIMPKIAQDSINHSELTFDTINITDITDASYLLTSYGSVKNAGSFDAAISFPSPVQVYWTNRPNNQPDLLLGAINVLPGFDVSGAAPKSGKVVIDPPAKVVVDSVDAMAEFSKFLVRGAAFSWRLKGKAEAKALGITVRDLNLNKVVNLNGFSGLKDVTITEFDLPDSDLIKGIFIKTTTRLINPSPIAIQLGDLTFTSYVSTSNIGTLSAQNVTLYPGVNLLPLSGHLKAIKAEDVETLGKVFSFYVGGQDTALTVVGDAVVPPAGACKWLSDGFVGLPMEVKLSPPTGAQQLVSGIKIPSISVQFDPSDPTGYSLKSSAPSISATFRSPFTFPLNIKDAAQDLTFIDPTTSTPFGRLAVPFTPAVANQTAQTLQTSFTNVPLTSIDNTAFQSFLKSLTTTDQYTFNVVGRVSAKADTAGGLVTIANVTLTDSITFAGLRGLPAVTVEKVNVKGGDEDGIELEIDTVIENPSQLAMDLGAIVVGSVVIPLMKLVPGRNVVRARSLFKPVGEGNVAAGRVMLSKFLQAKDQAVRIFGSASSTPYTSLQPAFSALSITSTLPAITTPLVLTARLLSIDLSVTPALAITVLTLTNPLGAPYTLTRLTSTVMYNNNAIGTIDQDLSDDPVVVAAGATVETRGIRMALEVSREALRALVEGIEGRLVVDIGATLGTRVGGFATVIDYELKGVKTVLG